MLCPTTIWSNSADGEHSTEIRGRVELAFQRQLERQGKSNNLLSTKEIDRFARLRPAIELLQRAMDKFNWSARAYHRVLKVARTIADLSNDADIKQQHVAEAIQYRSASKNINPQQ